LLQPTATPEARWRRRRVKATFNGTTTVYVGDYYEKTGSVWTTYYRANGKSSATGAVTPAASG